jgi:transposase
MVAADTEVARKAREMTRREVMMKAIAGAMTWVVAAKVLGLSERHVRRIRDKYEEYGVEAFEDGRAGRKRKRRVPLKTLEEVCRLKREVYADYSMQHFHEVVTEKHKLKLSYTLLRNVLQEAGLVQKAPGRGQYRRKRERRPMTGMLVHLDGSTHEWLPGLPMQDLIVALDDADGRILYARFVEQEGTASTFEALRAVLTRFGRFAELYTDRGSHFCRTPKAGGPSETDVQVSRALKKLGIGQILARSPEARGRSERAFGTIQGRLPQELRVAGITSYADANKYLERVFVRDFNRRFTVKPTLPETAFVKLVGIDLELVLAEEHTRIVAKDNTVSLDGVRLQLSPAKDRIHFARCEVTVHRFPDGGLAVSHLGRVLGRYSADGRVSTGHGTKRLRTA